MPVTHDRQYIAQNTRVPTRSVTNAKAFDSGASPAIVLRVLRCSYSTLSELQIQHYNADQCVLCSQKAITSGTSVALSVQWLNRSSLTLSTNVGNQKHRWLLESVMLFILPPGIRGLCSGFIALLSVVVEVICDCKIFSEIAYCRLQHPQ